ncbi:MAG: response regulator transcription factor [Defluviitaleaceae bacterium]|nr:response regulator transcription factor [Defluviitaleaceae bacterium]
MSKLIYLAEDEANIRIPLKAFLEKEAYSVVAFENGDLLFEAFQQNVPDLVILDVMMPGSNGFIICTKIRALSTIPIIMLTARGSDEDYTTGISLGSDDYLTKPFSPIKLVMRVKALFRRLEMTSTTTKKTEMPDKIEYGDLSIDPDSLLSLCKGIEFKLTNTELKFLIHLMQHKDKAISRDELLSKIWEHDYAIETRVTDDTVKRLRKKLIDAKSDVRIETIWGFGFRIGTKNEG